MGKEDLGDRMKRYERATIADIPENLPLIMRLDGKAFHTLTRGCEKPFDPNVIAMMDHVALALCDEIQNACLAYVQSDEISILIHKRWQASSWFDNDLQKIVSVSASIATWAAMCWCYENDWKPGSKALFDSRAFILPRWEVSNYFIWRQRDWERNSIQMLARSLYSQKQLHRKNSSELHELIHARGKNWNDLATSLKRGRCAVHVSRKVKVENEYFTGEVERGVWEMDDEIPIFTRDRDYIETRLEVNREGSEQRAGEEPSNDRS